MAKKWFYVYEIFDTVTGKKYIGSRVSKVKPTDDLGIKYFSSSSDKQFMHLQYSCPDRFIYTVLKEFNNKKDMVSYESFLHFKFDVANNKMFYNKANQTPTGYVLNDEAYEKMKKTMKKKKHQQGKNNSMYGTKWIKNDKKKLCTRIPKNSKIPKGWTEGRKMSYKYVKLTTF